MYLYITKIYFFHISFISKKLKKNQGDDNLNQKEEPRQYFFIKEF